MTSRHRALKGVAALSVILLAVIAWRAGSSLSAPANRSVGPPPTDFQAEPVNGENLVGWFVPGGSSGRCVALFHGMGANRTAMITRARFLKQGGFSTLLMDFQAHGEQPGERITFGYLESKNAHAAIEYLRKRDDCRKIGAIGQSLGGAASLVGNAPIPVDALILEAVYPTLDDAIANRLEIAFGKSTRLLTPLLSKQVPIRLGIALDSLRPIDAIRTLRAPLLVIAGAADRHTPLAESKALFQAAPEPKELWVLEGAEHVDFHWFATEAYEQRISSFFERYLQ